MATTPISVPVSGIGTVRWYGGHGLHLYVNRTETQYRTVGDQSRDMTRAEARAECEAI